VASRREPRERTQIAQIATALAWLVEIMLALGLDCIERSALLQLRILRLFGMPEVH
jgi:hypothetical protein